MNHLQFKKKLILHIERVFEISVESNETPPQGMSSFVFFIKTSDAHEYAVKYGNGAMQDIPALDLIVKNHVAIPIPKLFRSFVFEEVPVIVLERVQFPLLETVPREEISQYIPSMIENLRRLHTIKSTSPGSLSELNNSRTWKEIMLDIFVGDTFDWNEIAHRNGLDTKLVMSSVENIVKKINDTEFVSHEYSLLHTDFNQRNLFVDTQNHEITGIIDWEEAIFGDPIYDFARVRLFILHFNLGEQTINKYYNLMQFTPMQKELESLYLLSYMTQYLAWYSEKLNEFNTERIKLHQDYLREHGFQDSKKC